MGGAGFLLTSLRASDPEVTENKLGELKCQGHMGSLLNTRCWMRRGRPFWLSPKCENTVRSSSGAEKFTEDKNCHAKELSLARSPLTGYPLRGWKYRVVSVTQAWPGFVTRGVTISALHSMCSFSETLWNLKIHFPAKARKIRNQSTF